MRGLYIDRKEKEYIHGKEDFCGLSYCTREMRKTKDFGSGDLTKYKIVFLEYLRNLSTQSLETKIKDPVPISSLLCKTKDC